LSKKGQNRYLGQREGDKIKTTQPKKGGVHAVRIGGFFSKKILICSNPSGRVPTEKEKSTGRESSLKVTSLSLRKERGRFTWPEGLSKLVKDEKLRFRSTKTCSSWGREPSVYGN